MVRPRDAELLPVGGVIFMSEDVHTAEQVREDIAALQKNSPIPLWFGVDEEGGRVSRLSKLEGFPTLPAQADFEPDRIIRIAYSELGKALADLGFNVNFAPVADVLTNPKNKVIGDRAFSDNPKTAASYVRAAIAGMREQGVMAVPKHFPGHGDTAGDSHNGAVSSNVDLDRLREVEFVPFQEAIKAGVKAIMVGHIALPEVTGSDIPTTLNKEIVTGLLREELGFQGVIFTDALDMDAITDNYKPGEAAVLALQAGCDVLLMPRDLVGAQAGIIDAVLSERLDESVLDEALTRQFAAKWED